ncbi:MAG: hypothetical protein K1X47_06700 [Cyclobacteriaceae bacterium]|nr:hypothetical protein [Cyclobacteriaceae bacterium]
MTAFEQFLSTLDERGTFFLMAAVFFLLLSMSVTLLLLVRRALSRRDDRLLETLKETFQEPINTLVMLDGELTADQRRAQLNILTDVTGRSTFARQTLANEMVSLRKSLSGAAATALERTFVDLGLDVFCKSRLHFTSWKVKAKMIQDLTEMNCISREELQKLQNHSHHQTLKEAILIAMIRRDHAYALRFLDGYEGPLSQWMMVNLYQQLSQVHFSHVPDFSKWFGSRSEEVVLFCVRMTQHFRQLGSVDAMVPLLHHTSPRVIAATIQALHDLNAFQVADKVARIADLFYANDTISLQVARFIGRLSNAPAHVRLLEKYLVHPSFEVRHEAVSALMAMPDYGRNRLMAEQVHREPTLYQIIQHTSDPLLR